MNAFSRGKRLIDTVIHLKATQLYYRVYYAIRRKVRVRLNHTYPLTLASQSTSLILDKSISSTSIIDGDTFTFLNQAHNFTSDTIDWNYNRYGKLWTYNLCYFDYLLQEGITQERGLVLINNFVDNLESVSDGLMPFPISLRGINWIKFLTKHKIENQKINDSLKAQYAILMDNLEYHILGNHLLENGFSLLFGAYYFQDEKLYVRAKKILEFELVEQTLEDGAHFELSPMYHQLMLFRILDCINLIKNSQWKEQESLKLFVTKAEIMLGWLNTMTFEKGSIPLFNDSSNNIAPITEELNEYAKRLSIEAKDITLSTSGYRKVKHKHYEMMMDVGNIGPDYIPGHAHSDIFNFELYVGDVPVIVDTGLSTYETNDRRQTERSTRAHNTVMVDAQEQSEVWGGFRVGRRAKVVDVVEVGDSIKATHNGYIKKAILHAREFITKENTIMILDTLETDYKHTGVAYIHFYPNIKLEVNSEGLECEYFTLKSSHSIKLIDYEYSPEFNTRIKALCAEITFDKTLKIEIIIKT